MSFVEYEILTQWFTNIIEKNKCDLDIIFYLRSTPEICMERMKNRNRLEESNITIEYLQKLHNFHEKWLNSEVPKTGQYFYKPPFVIVINGDLPTSSVYKLIEEKLMLFSSC